MGITPEDIEGQDFERARKGYEPTAVRNYLSQVSRVVGDLQAELAEARRQAAAAEESKADADATVDADQFGALGERVAAMLRLAQESGSEIRTAAEAKADELLGLARGDADAMTTEAQALLESSRTEADNLLGEAKAQAETLNVESRLESEAMLSKAESEASMARE